MYFLQIYKVTAPPAPSSHFFVNIFKEIAASLVLFLDMDLQCCSQMLFPGPPSPRSTCSYMGLWEYGAIHASLVLSIKLSIPQTVPHSLVCHPSQTICVLIKVLHTLVT